MKNSPKASKGTVGAGLWAVFVLELVYIFFFLLNYDLAWMNSENFGTHAWILSNGNAWRAEDFARSLNIEVIESNTERISRPLSNLLEVINAKFRANVWDLMPPHPSLSLLWPLFFIGIPFFLYRFFRNMGAEAPIAFAGAGLYLTTIGFLGPVVMLFHPAKSLVNFFAVLTLFLGSIIYRNKAGGIGLWAAFLGSILCACLSDETGLFVYVLAAGLFYGVLFQWKKQPVATLGFLLLPAVYFLIVRFGLPYLHRLARGRHIDLAQYSSFPNPADLFWPDWQHWSTNLTWLWTNHPHVTFDFAKLFEANPWLATVHAVYVTAMLCVGALLIATIVRQGLRLRLVVCALLLLAYVFFYTFQLSNNAKVWGVWWYGSLYSLVYAIGLIFILQFIADGVAGPLFRRCFTFLAAIVILHGLAFSTYQVDILEEKPNHANYAPAQIFTGDIYAYYKDFSYTGSMQISQCRRWHVLQAWAKAKHKHVRIAPARLEECQSILTQDKFYPKEATYLSIEL